MVAPSPWSLRATAVALLALFGQTEAIRRRGSGSCQPSTPSALQVYPLPTEVAKSTAFKVQVRLHDQANATWQDVELYQANLHEINRTTGSAMVHASSLGLFDFDEPVELSIKPNRTIFQSIDAVRLRPLSYGLAATKKEDTINIVLEKPANIVLEVNGDIFNVLHLFLDETEKNPVSQNSTDESLIYFGPGFHSIDGGKGTVNVSSGQTVYLAPGSVVQGGFAFRNVSDATIRGRGVVYKTSSDTILVESSKNIRVDGLTMLNPGHYSIMAGMVEGLHVSRFRSISAVQWGDGIDVFCSKDVLLEGLFMRNSDDCIALYQHRWEYYGDSSNITVKDSSLWADVAHPINLGTHGNSVNPETMDGVTFSNIDILDHREPQIDYQGCVAISCGDSNLIQNVHVENIRIEDFREGMLLNFRVMYNSKYNTSPGRGIRNVTLHNVTYNGTGENMAIMAGYDDTRTIDFVDFQGLEINGQHIWDKMKKPSWYQTADIMPMYVGSWVNNLTFSA